MRELSTKFLGETGRSGRLAPGSARVRDWTHRFLLVGRGAELRERDVAGAYLHLRTVVSTPVTLHLRSAPARRRLRATSLQSTKAWWPEAALAMRPQ